MLWTMVGSNVKYVCNKRAKAGKTTGMTLKQSVISGWGLPVYLESLILKNKRLCILLGNDYYMNGKAVIGLLL